MRIPIKHPVYVMERKKAFLHGSIDQYPKMVVLCSSIGTWDINKIFIEIQRQIMTVSKIRAMDPFGDMVLGFFVTSDSN